jgi:hypothetical protein
MAVINSLAPFLDEAYEKLNKIDESTFQEIINALNSAEVELHPGELAAKIIPNIKNINLSDLQDIFMGFSTFVRYKKSRDFAYEEIIDDIIKLIQNGETKSIKLSSKNEVEKFRNRLLLLFNNKKLELSQIASDYYYDHHNLFNFGEINVDIRPVFDDGNTKYAVLNTTLHIDFRSEGERKSIYMGIDRSDIKMLKKIIEEAEKKIRITESTIEKIGMKELKTEREQI